jgi:hypothetical protein
VDSFVALLTSITSSAAEPVPSRTASIPEQLAADVVRSIAWGGDRRRGAARIELAGERFGGTRIVVEVEGNRLRLSLDAPSGVDTLELRSRLCSRFAERGLEVETA